MLKIPNLITAGDDYSWTDSIDNYPASDGWVLSYVLLGDQFKLQIDATTNADGLSYDSALSTTQSETLAPGIYSWQAFLSQTGSRRTLDTGKITVAQDLANTEPGAKAKTQLEQLLDLVNDAISKRLKGETVLRYDIRNRRLDRDPIPDLIALRNQLKIDISAEKAAASLATGGRNPNRLLVRFGPRTPPVSPILPSVGGNNGNF